MKPEEVMASYNIRSIIYDIQKQKGQLTIDYGTEGDRPFHQTLNQPELAQLDKALYKCFTATHSKWKLLTSAHSLMAVTEYYL